MRKLFLILVYCAIIAIPAHQTMASHEVVAGNVADHSIFVGNQTDGNVAIYFTGDNGGARGYIGPNSGDSFGPIPGGTYNVLVVTNAPGTHTFTVNDQSVTNDNGQATFTVDVTTNVYVLVQ